MVNARTDALRRELATSEDLPKEVSSQGASESRRGSQGAAIGGGREPHGPDHRHGDNARPAQQPHARDVAIDPGVAYLQAGDRGLPPLLTVTRHASSWTGRPRAPYGHSRPAESHGRQPCGSRAIDRSRLRMDAAPGGLLGVAPRRPSAPRSSAASRADHGRAPGSGSPALPRGTPPPAAEGRQP